MELRPAGQSVETNYQLNIIFVITIAIEEDIHNVLDTFQSMTAHKKQKLLGTFFNIWWSLLCFYPLLMYWTDKGLDKYFYFFLIGSFIALFIRFPPINDKRKRKMAIKIYENLGVKFFRKCVQGGDYSWLMETHEKQIASIAKAKTYVRQIEMYQRFHLSCAVFFFLSTLHACHDGDILSGIYILIAGTIYNIPTLMLQRYNRLKIDRLIDLAR